MQVKLWEAVLPVVALIIAGWTAILQSSPWAVLVTAAVFACVVVLTYRQPGREVYLLVAGVPLVVATGLAYLWVGVTVQIILLVILFLEDIAAMERPAGASFLAVPAVIAGIALLAVVLRVFTLFLVLLAISVPGAFLITTQSRVLKRKYSEEQA